MIGKTQEYPYSFETHDINRALESAKEELLKGRNIQISIMHFYGEKTKYEVYVDYKEA